MKMIMYGAGSIGRGFIGPLFAKAGYEVAFIDIDKRIVDALNSRGAYNYTVAADPPYDVAVSGVRGIDGTDERAVLDEIASCDIMATALGATALRAVAPVIAKAFSLRMRKSGNPLNLLICENLKNAAHLLRDWLAEALPETDKPLLAAKMGLIEAAIGRMVPVTAQNSSDPLHITVEEYGFLPVDKDAFIGTPPEAEGLVLHSPFAFYEERKLYLHNMGHAICAYLGLRRGLKTIAQAISDPSIRYITQSAMVESAAMLSIKYGVPFTRVFDHAEDLLLRFGNVALGDTCERVGRDPMRKLEAGDRLAGALGQCRDAGVYPVYIALGYAAALLCVTDDIETAAGIARDTGKLSDEHIRLATGLFAVIDRPAEELISAAERLKKQLRGSII